MLLSYILKAGHLTRLTVRSTRAGTFGSVQYILRLPSGTEYGWPDFQMYQRFSQEERQLCRPVGAEETVRAVGEVQSPPGMSSDIKNRTFAQAGIYTLGHFRHSINWPPLFCIRTSRHMLLSLRLTGQLERRIWWEKSHTNSFNLRHTSDLTLCTRRHYSIMTCNG